MRRIQRRRVRGWQGDTSPRYVGRPGKWGNPYRIGTYAPAAWEWAGVRWAPNYGPTVSVSDAATAVLLFDRLASASPEYVADVRRELAGRVLACWCSPDAPCHADVLLRIANGGTS